LTPFAPIPAFARRAAALPAMASMSMCLGGRRASSGPPAG